MDSSLLDYSLDLSKQLDKMFNKTTKVGIVQEDVPGISIGKFEK